MPTTRFAEARRAIALNGAVKVAETLHANQHADRDQLQRALVAELERGHIRADDYNRAMIILADATGPGNIKAGVPTLPARDRSHELLEDVVDLDARAHDHGRRIYVLECFREAHAVMGEKIRADLAALERRVALIEHQAHHDDPTSPPAVEPIGDPAAEAAFHDAAEGLPEDAELGVSAFGFAGGARARPVDEREVRADTGTPRGL